MNRIRSSAPRALLLLLLGVVLTPGCDAPLPVTPKPPAGSIAGTWIGTMTVVDEWAESSCEEPTTATFTQSGSTVSGTLTDSSGCGGSNQYSFEGTLEGNLVTGKIKLPVINWTTKGAFSGDHLIVSARNITWDLHR
jgi:lipocalin-like protein